MEVVCIELIERRLLEELKNSIIQKKWKNLYLFAYKFLIIKLGVSVRHAVTDKIIVNKKTQEATVSSDFRFIYYFETQIIFI